MCDISPPHHAPIQTPAGEAWRAREPDPVQEYRRLAHELQEACPHMEAQHLDRVIAREMALYGGYSVAVVQQAMLAASLQLAAGNVDDAHDYVARTVDEAMRQDPTDETVLGWGV